MPREINFHCPIQLSTPFSKSLLTSPFYIYPYPLALFTCPTLASLALINKYIDAPWKTKSISSCMTLISIKYDKDIAWRFFLQYSLYQFPFRRLQPNPVLLESVQKRGILFPQKYRLSTFNYFHFLLSSICYTTGITNCYHHHSNYV